MSLTERPVSTALKNMLVNNEPFLYAHLIKFERPSRPLTTYGQVSTSKERYTYLTDASVNVDFDDGSTDLLGNYNDSQTYLANKVLSVGAIQEQTKATTSSTTLVLDGTALGASITATVNIATTVDGADLWDLTFQAPVQLDDIINAGFREGDKVTLNGTSFNIKSFRSGNVVRVEKIDNSLTAQSNVSLTMKLASEEIISILLNKNSSDYSSFINREVYIYRAYFQNGVMVGTPIPIFKGIIYSVNFEDSETGIKVSWGLTSHWGDFAQVKGRVTSDSAHRALNENGIPQPDSALKKIYAYDKGFSHSESAIHMLATYTVMVEKMDIKSKKGFLGIGAGVKTKKYFVPEDRHTNLDFELNAKSIPVVYGTRVVEGIGVFADTLASDSATVYVATVLSEGEIGGIYDIYIDGNSLICNDQADFDARAAQTRDNTVKLVCRGRADRGDALGGQTITSSPYQFYDGSTGDYISLGALSNFMFSWNIFRYNYGGYNWALPQYSTYGIVDGESISLYSPIDMTLDFFSGKPGQKASAQLSSIAYAGITNPANGFKIQKDYWNTNDTNEYWGPNHRLLDTAYVVGKFKIAEGETTIPEIKYVIRGKAIDCYNYDYSYLHDVKTTGELDTNFNLGDTVSLYYNNGPNYSGGTETLLNANVQIIDKWSFRNPDGTVNTRFRFSAVPALNYTSYGVPTITKFYMKSAGGNTWTMTTFNHNLLNSTNVGGTVAATITGVSTTGTKITFSYATNAAMAIENDPVDTSAKFQVMKSDYSTLTSGDLFPYTMMVGTATSTLFTSNYLGSASAGYSSSITSEAAGVITVNSDKLVSRNTIILPASASSVDGFYNGTMIEITRYDSTSGKNMVQVAEIIGYTGASRIATIDTIWDFIPLTTDYVRIYPKYADSRVSINPAIQALDYISSKTYGRGLDVFKYSVSGNIVDNKDIDLPSWTETARKCDTGSNVTVNIGTTAPTGLLTGAVYKFTNGGRFVWQGTALGYYSVSVKGTTYYLVEFTNCVGKLTNKWNSWKSWKVGDIVYNGDTFAFTSVVTAGTIIQPTTSTVTSLALTKSSGSGPATITVPLSANVGNPVQAYKNGSKISGYSLYDADDINFWRLSGWDDHDQRYVTKNQTNILIDTSAPLFDNINGMLEHFNGILRYTAGKYYLDVEEAAGTILTTDIRTITADDIIGKIQLSDEGARSAFNSLTAAFADPSNKFEARSISFFNSEYLKADRNVPKKGNLSIPGITNYYNTRLLADSFLNKSRYGLTINMTIRPHGILFLAGTVIQVVYPRYDWTSPGKKFRIESITYQSDGFADIVAKEYDDSFYAVSNIARARGSGSGSTGGSAGGVILNPTSRGPTGLTASTDKYNQIVLTWTNGADAGLGNTFVEIWRSTVNDFTTASIIDVVPVTVVSSTATQQYIDSIAPVAGGVSSLTRYYWVRHKVIQ